MKKYFLSGIVLLVAFPAYAAVLGNLTCESSKQYVCSSNGCMATTSPLTIKIQLGSKGVGYHRCIGGACDDFTAIALESGDDMVITAFNKSPSLRVNTKENLFVETNTQGLSVEIAFGKCQQEETIQEEDLHPITYPNTPN